MVSNSGAYVLDTRTGAVLRSLAVLGGKLALDRRAQRLIILGNRVTHGPEPVWERGRRRWMSWLPHRATPDATIHALTIDVSH